jgi:ferredoxin
MEHVGKACNMPQDVCLTFNNTASSLAKHNIAKEITKKEAQEILDRCVKLGLVQIGDNVQDNVNFICNCCSCCCEALLAYKKLKYNVRMESNFESVVNNDKCISCGVCIKKCPVNAISFKKNNTKGADSKDKKNVSLFIDSDICIGCGVCVRFCKNSALVMERRKTTRFTPKDSFERTIITAINNGKLQNLILDNRSIWTHKMLRRLIQIIFSLKPAKRALATNQLKSRFIHNMSKAYGATFNKLLKNPSPDYSHPELKSKK